MTLSDTGQLKFYQELNLSARLICSHEHPSSYPVQRQNTGPLNFQNCSGLFLNVLCLSLTYVRAQVVFHSCYVISGLQEARGHTASIYPMMRSSWQKKMLHDVASPHRIILYPHIRIHLPLTWQIYLIQHSRTPCLGHLTS